MAQTPFNSRREDLVMLATDTIRGQDSTTGNGDVLALRGGNSTGGGGDGAHVTVAGGLAHTTGNGGSLILASGVAPGAGAAGDVELTAASSAAGTDGTVRVNGANQSLHGGDALQRFQILGGALAAITGDATGPSVYLAAQGSATRDGAQVTVANSLVSNGSFIARGGNGISGNTAGGSADLFGGIGFGSGNGAQSSVQAGAGGSVGRNGGYAFVLAGVAGAAGNGNGGGVVITAQAGLGSGTPGDISLTTNGGVIKTRTTTGFAGSEKELQTHGVQFSSTSGGGILDVVTLGSLDTNGRNMKIEASVTVQNNAVDGDFLSFKIITSAWRAGGSVTMLITPHLTSHEGNAVSPSFVTDLLFAVASSGDDINLTLRNSNGATTYTLNTAVEWTRQEGGFAS